MKRVARWELVETLELAFAESIEPSAKKTEAKMGDPGASAAPGITGQWQTRMREYLFATQRP